MLPWCAAQGDVAAGLARVKSSGDPQLHKDCAAILESKQQWQDAAMLYEAGGANEKAAELYIRYKSFAQAAPLMSSITTPKLHLQFAEAKEAEVQRAVYP